MNICHPGKEACTSAPSYADMSKDFSSGIPWMLSASLKASSKMDGVDSILLIIGNLCAQYLKSSDPYWLKCYSEIWNKKLRPWDLILKSR